MAIDFLLSTTDPTAIPTNSKDPAEGSGTLGIAASELTQMRPVRKGWEDKLVRINSKLAANEVTLLLSSHLMS